MWLDNFVRGKNCLLEKRPTFGRNFPGGLRNYPDMNTPHPASLLLGALGTEIPVVTPQ
jgi:hypothetical protein